MTIDERTKHRLRAIGKRFKLNEIESSLVVEIATHAANEVGSCCTNAERAAEFVRATAEVMRVIADRIENKISTAEGDET